MAKLWTRTHVDFLEGLFPTPLQMEIEYFMKQIGPLSILRKKMKIKNIGTLVDQFGKSWGEARPFSDFKYMLSFCHILTVRAGWGVGVGGEEGRSKIPFQILLNLM